MLTKIPNPTPNPTDIFFWNLQTNWFDQKLRSSISQGMCKRNIGNTKIHKIDTVVLGKYTKISTGQYWLI